MQCLPTTHRLGEVGVVLITQINGAVAFCQVFVLLNL